MLASGGGVEAMVHVVIPLRGVTFNPAPRPTFQPVRLVLLILQNEMDVAILPERQVHPLRQLFQQMLWAVVHDGMDRIQTQAIEMKLLQPIEGVVNYEFPRHGRIGAVVVDGVAPGGLVAVREESAGRRLEDNSHQARNDCRRHREKP